MGKVKGECMLVLMWVRPMHIWLESHGHDTRLRWRAGHQGTRRLRVNGKCARAMCWMRNEGHAWRYNIALMRTRQRQGRRCSNRRDLRVSQSGF